MRCLLYEEFEDTKGIIRIRQSVDRQFNETTQWLKEKGQKEKQRSTKHHEHRKLKIEQHESY